jgi:predicted  nucleic acid-binding Zn-ribbon protein
MGLLLVTKAGLEPEDVVHEQQVGLMRRGLFMMVSDIGEENFHIRKRLKKNEADIAALGEAHRRLQDSFAAHSMEKNIQVKELVAHVKTHVQRSELDMKIQDFNTDLKEWLEDVTRNIRNDITQLQKEVANNKHVSPH